MGIFFTSPDEEKEEKKPEPIAVEKGFPASTQKFPDTAPVTGFPQSAAPVTYTTPNTYLDDAIKIYEKGFEGLNQPGVDFYEFYKAVSIDLTNPSAYKMAMSVLQGIDAGFTKDKAVSDAQHYVDNIIEAHKGFAASGNGKLSKLRTDKESEASSLNGEITTLSQQISDLQSQLKSKQGQLETIDGKYDGKLTEVEGRLMANDNAKDILLDKIKTVVTNIKNNL